MIRQTRSKLLLLLPILAVAAFSVTSYAATVTTSSVSNQAQYGVNFDLTTNFSAQDKGFSTVSSTTSASTQPATWSNGGTVNTALTKGDYQYKVLLTLNTPPASTTTYTVTVKWAQGSGAQTQMGQLTVSVPNTATASQTMTLSFDTGGTSFTTPAAIDVTVA